MALNENKNNSENKDRKIVCISLSNKNYSLNNLFGVNRDSENILRLDFFDNIICELSERNANKLKRETTRALYFLLSESKEIFAFGQFIPIKIASSLGRGKLRLFYSILKNFSTK